MCPLQGIRGDSGQRDVNGGHRDPVRGLRGSSYDSWSQSQALSMSDASKYRTLAIVNGLQTLAIHDCHFVSPTRAMRSNFVQCVVENLMSSQSAARSHP